MDTLPPPLPRSLDPLPDETLPGYLLRLAYRLEVSPGLIAAITGLTKNARLSVIPGGLLLQLNTTENRRFSHVCRLTPAEATGLCLASLASRYPPLDLTIRDTQPPFWQPRLRLQQAGGLTGLGRWVFTTSTRYCPRCLAGDTSPAQQRYGGPWKRSWRIPLVFACTIHRRLLATHCPACNAPAHYGSGLISRPGELLHPAQCRAVPQTPAPRRGHGQLACGHRLDREAAGTQAVATARILDLQHRLLTLLRPDGPATVISIGRPVSPSHYMLDLRLITAVMQLTWPTARNLTDAASFTEAIDEHVDRHRKAMHRLGEQGRMVALVSFYDAPPLEPPACAGLLDAATQLLDLTNRSTFEATLQPLLARTLNDQRWIRFINLAMPACSPVLQAVLAGIETKQNAQRPPSRRGENLRHNTMSYRWRASSPSPAPRPSCQFDYRHVPQHLTAQWFERHLAPVASNVHPRVLRRAAAIRLVQMTRQLNIGEASALLEIPENLSRPALVVTDRWARSHSGNASRLIAALDAIADELESFACPIDYARRRHALRAWTIPPAEWDDIATQLRARPSAGHITQWEDRYRQVASVLAWMQITQGERLCAPLVRAHRQPGTKSQLRADLCQAAYQGRRRFLMLQEVVQPYAQQLADRIDHGEAIISGLFPA